MKKRIIPSDCKTMFNDKLNTLNMKELGIELKHFAVGTAPECPSFLVNQDELKKKIIDKFTNFFDEDKTQGLEVLFLKSNYGNGKSHFIRTIYSFLCNFENVLTKNVSLKQEKTDLKFKILEGIGQKVIKQCATYFVDNAIEESQNNDKDTILLALTESLSIDFTLAELLYQTTIDDEISQQTHAIAILKGNYLPTYLKTFKIKRNDLNNEFYFNVIRLICNYLLENHCYLVIVFDEYEHIYSWKDNQSRNTFFSDIKYFTDNIDTYKNLFFVFAESEAADSNTEIYNDPAYVSRKKSLTFQILDISSDIEIERLYKMIKSRYEKYYEISLDDYSEEILNKVKEDPQVKTNSNYRNYTQVIMRILEQYRNKPIKAKKCRKVISDVTDSNLNEVSNSDAKLSIEDRWKAAKSISRKSILCDALKHILVNSNEKVIDSRKKTGVYKTQKDNIIKSYYIVATDCPNSADFTKRYNNALRDKEENAINDFKLLYPFKEGLSNSFLYDNVIFYCVDSIPNILQNIYSSTKPIDDVDKYLEQFKLGC